jgi:hypothetical protein
VSAISQLVTVSLNRFRLHPVALLERSLDNIGTVKHELQCRVLAAKPIQLNERFPISLIKLSHLAFEVCYLF